MAFTVPGIQGKPIAANDFTRRFRGNPNILSWLTLQRNATFDDESGYLRMIPRKGAHLARNSNPAGATWDGSDQIDGLEFFVKEPGSAPWELTAPFPNDGDGYGITLVFRATAGYTEPGTLRFSDNSLVFPQPNHGGSSGPIMRTSSGSNIAAYPGRSAIPSNSIGYVNMSFRYSDRRVSWQSMGRGVEQTIAPEEWAVQESAPTFNLVVGRANAAQPFAGTLFDAAIWNSDFLDNEDHMMLVSEYVASTYGV